MTLKEQFGESWYNRLSFFLKAPEMLRLGEYVVNAKDMTPSWENVFKAYKLVQPEQLKVLIIGQDPYPTRGQAMGLAFSSGLNVLPYSLSKIFTDLQLCDYDSRLRKNPDLTDWAEQGVMLLNTCLTTKVGEPFAHKKWGWQYLIAETLKIINQLEQPYVVMAWGKPAQELADKYIRATPNHLILRAAHPANERYQKNSYVGSKHFSAADEFFRKHGIEPIKWI